MNAPQTETNGVAPSRTTALSVFSNAFVPAWMLQVARIPTDSMFTLKDESLREDVSPEALCTQDLYPLKYFNALTQDRTDYETQAYTAHVYRSNRQTLISVPALSQDTYAARLMPLLMTEYNAVTANLANSTLYNVTVEPLERSKKQAHLAQAQFFKFEAKQIREGWPPVTIGDAVLLKPLNWAQRTAEGVCLEARVWSLQRAAGLIVIRCDKLIYIPGMTFVIQWKVQDRFFRGAHSAIAAVDRALTTTLPPSSRLSRSTTPLLTSPPAAHSSGPLGSQGTAAIRPAISSSSASPSSPAAASPHVRYDLSLTRSWLFPVEDDLPPSPVNWPSENIFNWLDADLNPEQKKAVRAIVYGQRRIPFLVSGPPGTGKTKMLVESIFQLLRHQPHAHILVCGASNPSADTLCRRLAAGGLDPKTLFRLNHASRPLDEVRSDITMFCRLNVEHGQFEMPPLQELLAYRVVVTSAADASLLYDYHACNSSLQTLSHHVLSTIYPLAPQPTRPHWTHLLFDEAAQAHEPDSLVPISVLLPIAQEISSDNDGVPPQIVLCGDMQQLGPRIWSEEARSRDLDNSLLSRLFMRSVYANHPEARRHLRSHTKKTLTSRKKGLANGIRTSATQADIPFVNLIRNYRSHTAILCGPSAMFYEDTLVPCASESVLASTLPNYPGQVRPGYPVSFWDSDSVETMVDEGASWANYAEVDKVCDTVQDLLSWVRESSTSRLYPKDISVISPFREQVWQIRQKLRSVGLFEVDVGDVEALQGAENRVVILSTVRSRKQFLEADRQRSRGLILEPRRLCVALTRAKELLIVVGNASLLKESDPWWKIFLQYCVRQGCYHGPPLEGIDPKSPEGMSTLEVRLIGTNPDAGPDGFTALASGVASVGMRDE